MSAGLGDTPGLDITLPPSEDDFLRSGVDAVTRPNLLQLLPCRSYR
ncbi:unnamed protein product [[Actinomadura] parvosata subsp. kistnae]|nr:hypothetical protein [Nonomuraea sp. ATCC 55076]SPL94827.1 unnamed protein product [Actinomadura parvosata subsp. kistnae]